MPAQRRPDDIAAVNPYGVVNNTANRTMPHKLICKVIVPNRLKEKVHVKHVFRLTRFEELSHQRFFRRELFA